MLLQELELEDLEREVEGMPDGPPRHVKMKDVRLLRGRVSKAKQQHREAHRKTEVEASFRYEEMESQLQSKLTAMSRELSTTQEKVGT